MGLAYSVYYPIALVGGVIFAAAFLGLFMKATKNGATLAKLSLAEPQKGAALSRPPT